MIDLLAQAQPDNVFTRAWWDALVTREESWQILPTAFKFTVAAILTVGLYSLLYRENRFYRFVEHLFIGLATGFSVVGIVWEPVLHQKWWVPMVGAAGTDETAMKLAYWPWAVVLPIGVLAFFVFSKKHGWLSRIPIGIILGLWAGQQFNAFQNRYLPQLADSARPFIPNQFTLSSRLDPSGTLTVPDAINNLIVMATFIVVLSYFLYSFEQQSKLFQRSAIAGRWLLMVGFGAIFGTTMMTRFSLFIDRAYFLLIEWLKLGPIA
ncbi:MAG: hypothetical protein IH851_08115 [Armatimonadetes bacterium]|nr:hypothetical protein [Armatimonadota bacterium]